MKIQNTDPELRQQLLALARKFEDAWNSNDAVALAALFTEDAVLVEQTGPVYGRKAIEQHYAAAFQNVHFSNHRIRYGPECPHVIGTAGKEMWQNGAWSITWRIKGGAPANGRGYHSSIAVHEDGIWKKRLVTSNVTPPPRSTR